MAERVPTDPILQADDESRAVAVVRFEGARAEERAATYFPEANPLVPVGSYAEGSHTPTDKSVVISIAPAQ